MPREHPDYRDTMEQLNRLFPERLMVSRQEAAQVINSSLRTVDRYLPRVNGDVPLVALAKYMCGGGVK